MRDIIPCYRPTHLPFSRTEVLRGKKVAAGTDPHGLEWMLEREIMVKSYVEGCRLGKDHTERATKCAMFSILASRLCSGW